MYCIVEEELLFMLNKSIAYRLSVFISIAVISVFIAIIFISYLFNSQYVNEDIKNKAIALSNELITKIEEPLVATREVSLNISQQIVFYSRHRHPELLIRSLMKMYPFINTIIIHIDSDVPNLKSYDFYSYRENDSIFFETHNEKYYHCLNEKSIIEDISKNKQHSWTKVFLCQRNQNQVVSSYSPVFYGNEDSRHKAGYVICEVSLNNLNDTLNSIKVGENGFAFLLSEDGRFMTHPVKEFVLKKSIFSESEGALNKKRTNLKRILKKGLSGSFVAYPKFLNGKKHWVYYTRLKEIKWTVVFAMPYNQLFKPLYISILKMLLISVLGIIIIYFLIRYITNRLVNPLSVATNRLMTFVKETGDIGGVDSLNEIKLVSESLNTLKSGYEKFKIKQSEEEKKNQRQMMDLLQAAEIQRSLIKTDFSIFEQIKEIDLFAIYKPVQVVSGDLFDFFFDNNDNLIFTMGDVSGKGVPAAFFMSIAQPIIRNSAKLFEAGKIMQDINDKLFTINKHQFFLTLFLGVLNLKTGKLNYCNAAHTPSYILKASGEINQLDQMHGLPLGLYSGKTYNNAEIKLEKGDSIFLYTDGVTDMRDENGVHFGNERLIDNLYNLIGEQPKELVLRIEKSVETFRGESAQTDDITIMNIKYNK